MLQLSPPLICDMELFDEIVDIVRVGLRKAAALVAADVFANGARVDHHRSWTSDAGRQTCRSMTSSFSAPA